MALVKVTTTARCIQCAWTDDTPKADLEARRHSGEGALGKKPGPKHATVVEGAGLMHRTFRRAGPKTWLCDTCGTPVNERWPNRTEARRSHAYPNTYAIQEEQ